MSKARKILEERLARGEIEENEFERLIEKLSFKAVDPRQLWEHEDKLINQRITWLGVSQGLLFAAYAVIISNKILNQSLNEILNLITVVGAVVSFLVLVGTIAAVAALFIINKENPNSELEVTRTTTLMGLVPALGIPLVFLCSWLFLYACRV